MFLAAAAALIVAWFAGGTVWNVRRGSALLRWMQPALKLLGDRTTVRWMGSTAVEMVIADAKPPFRSVTLVVFLEPRDMPWLWALSRRKDTLIVRGELRAAPAGDLEALDLRSWSGRDAQRKASGLPLKKVVGGATVWASSEAVLGRAQALLELANRSGLPVRRMSVHRTAPHVQLHVEAPGEGASPGPLFEAVRELGERA
jgi:hypothetical protein